jgi:hypothetical protein
VSVFDRNLSSQTLFVRERRHENQARSVTRGLAAPD